VDKTQRARWKLASAGFAFVLTAAACQGAASPSPSASPAASAAVSPSAAPSSAGEPVEIEWFIGLGTGQNPEQVAAEEAVVEAWNEANPNVQVKLTIVDNTEAANTLTQRLAANDPPDILGPVGIRGLQQFGDQLLDLTPYLGTADLSGIEPSLIEAFNVDGKQIGLPTGVYSSFIYYNRTLFEEAGVAEPPHEVGEQYEGKPWNWDTLRELAMQLTVDGNGNDATSAAFDADDTVQFGFDAHMVENDIRAWGTEFGGAGSVVADDGSTAQIPGNWHTGLKFWYDGIWEDGYIPSKQEVDGITGAPDNSNTFQFGHTAMALGHQWYTCCVYPGADTGLDPMVTDWDLAVLPEGIDGEITSKLHADTIGIMATTEHPAEAFAAMTYFSSNAELVQTWGALPAIADQRDAFFAARDEQFAPLEIDWTVSTKMLEFPDVPSHEGPMPNFAEADSSNKSLGNKLWTTPGLDVDDELDAQVDTLQALFDEAS
jgi:multiple sugar transport system substrate-binding protein